MRYDFAVVGNGPAGSLAAAFGAKEYETLIVGPKISRMQCAGLISCKGLERIGVDPAESVLNTVSGAKLVPPNGDAVEVWGKRDMAYVVDRVAFDQMLLDRAQDAGAHYERNWVKSLDGGLSCQNSKSYESDCIILATGTDYGLHWESDLDHPRKFLVGGQYEMDVECEQDIVELHFCVPDFFAWVIPVKDHARVGLCVYGNPRPHLDRFVGRLEKMGRLRSKKVLGESFGVIPIHDPKTRIQYPNVRLLGDAAGQVKASTGGGIVYGGLAAGHVFKNDYERTCRGEFGLELRLHLFIHRFLGGLSLKGRDRFFSQLGDAVPALESQQDMDSAKKTILGLLSDPRFMARSLVNLPHIVASFI